MIITALVFLLILSILVLIHEAGHYFVAKKFGIKVEEFGFGFPLTPPLWHKKIGETVYSFYPILIGGFVKLYGEDEAGSGKVASKNEVATQKALDLADRNYSFASENEAVNKKGGDLKRAFFMRPVWQRALVVGAGVFMNALLAVVLYYTFLGMSGFKAELPLLGKHTFFGANQTVTTQVIVSEVAPGSPAANAGIKKYSQIIDINGIKMYDMDTFSRTIKENVGKPLTLTWKEGETGKSSTVTVIPRENPPKGQGALGVAFFPVNTVTLAYDTPVQKAFSGIVHPTNLMLYNFNVLGQLISVSIKEGDTTPISQGVSGPVGIYSVVGSIVDLPDMKERIVQLLNLAGLLSISLAFFNILPIPALDGGRLFFILAEGLTGKKINPQTEGKIHAIGMALLLLFLLLVTIKDITQQFNK